MNPTRALVLALLSITSCAGSPSTPSAAPAPPPRAATAPVPEHLATDTPRTTPGGASFTAPGGWSVTTLEQAVVLTPPESGLFVAIVDARGADAAAAIANAWKTVRPEFKRPVRISQPLPGRRGWEERVVVEYETSPNEKAAAEADAVRRGDTWAVLLVDGDLGVLDRRSAGLNLAAGSLRPKGEAPESFAGKTAKPLDAARAKEIADFVEWAREEAAVPGVAIALVADGKVVHEAGFGVRELGRTAKVTPDTLFMIASNTKSLTTLMLAKLVDAGKLDWSTPAATLLPGFALGDAEVTRSVQVKHLICACTGLPRQDMEWLFEYKSSTPKTALATLAGMKPTTKFGETFQYSNPLAAAAGYIGGHVAFPGEELGAAYDHAMRALVFEPLGMKRTTFDFARALREEHASAHGEDVDGAQRVASMDPNLSIVPVRPAGGAWSSVRDVAKVALMELAKGKLPDGRTYVGEAALLERRAPQVTFGDRQTYGMGLEVDRTKDIPIVHHGGSLIGFKSDYFFLPEHGVGGVILTNADAGGVLLRPFVRRTLEVLFDARAEAKEDLLAAVKRRKAAIAKERERLVVPPDPLVATRLARTYTNPALGSISVTPLGKDVVLDVGEWKSPLATRKNDDGTTSMITTAPGMSGVDLVIGVHGGRRELVLRDDQHEYVFVEAP